MKIAKGIFAVYKPAGITSHDMVNRIRRLTGERRVGHAGTLDPLARGILVIGVGREATKRLKDIEAKEKEYLAVIKLGTKSSTDDDEGEKEIITGRIPIRSEIDKVLDEFKGEISQVPPVYSAIKVAGRAAYRYARAGKPIVLASRRVLVKEIKLISYKWPLLKLKVVTGPGVYIRSLARDIGEKLEVGAYLADLERTRIGEFNKNTTVI
jgi:tRNA pseudouridine55 synthase